MTRHVLVHGAWHGAWCWDLLRLELQSRGHDAVTVDLPIERREATFDDYADVIVGALGDGTEAVLVAHSLAGIPSTIAALRRPPAALVYLCAVLPKVEGMDRTGEPVQADDSVFATLRRNADGSTEWGEESAAVATLYPDCPSAVAASAYRRLRPQQTGIWKSMRTLPAWPATPTRYVVCRDDVVVRADWGRWASRHWLGVTASELDGGHSPMLSRPAELADVLDVGDRSP